MLLKSRLPSLLRPGGSPRRDLDGTIVNAAHTAVRGGSTIIDRKGFIRKCREGSHSAFRLGRPASNDSRTSLDTRLVDAFEERRTSPVFRDRARGST